MSIASIVASAVGSLSSDLVREGTIERVATGGYNPTTGKASATTSSTSTVSGPVENYSVHELKWTIAADGIDPVRTNDLVDFGEETADGDRIRYRVIDPHPMYAGENVALYELQLRR